MRVTSRGTKLLALLLGFALFASACGSDKKKSSSSKTPQNATTAPVSVKQGGTLVIGAEQEPDCADWFNTCAAASWGYWTMQVQTMPRAYDIVKENGKYVYKPSILLTGEPKLVTSPKQTVTYDINPKAVWNDGQPITSTDFKYTWDQAAHDKSTYDRTGYEKIQSVDDSNPKVAVVTFKSPYPDYQQLFAGNYGVAPSHLLAGKNRDAIMKNGYSFSGGPWQIQKWDKTNQITLVPNAKYWGAKPKLAKIIFKIQADTSAEFTAFKSDQVSMIYPQPQLDAVSQITAGLPNTQKVISLDTAAFESLWLNDAKPPLDSKAVRQAVAYAIDRDAIVKRLFGQLGLTQPLNVVNAPIVSDYSDTTAFADFKVDKGKVDSLLTGAGYKKGSDGIYAKGGQKLTFTVKSTAGNK
ncbi:MAG: ABC transporter substrate-binding protein, partial [Actinomycetota bacterium]|nr:ABC transporter substrate-binding protein [Actinomycetota bacterium]